MRTTRIWRGASQSVQRLDWDWSESTHQQSAEGRGKTAQIRDLHRSVWIGRRRGRRIYRYRAKRKARIGGVVKGDRLPIEQSKRNCLSTWVHEWQGAKRAGWWLLTSRPDDPARGKDGRQPGGSPSGTCPSRSSAPTATWSWCKSRGRNRGVVGFKGPWTRPTAASRLARRRSSGPPRSRPRTSRLQVTKPSPWQRLHWSIAGSARRDGGARSGRWRRWRRHRNGRPSCRLPTTTRATPKAAIRSAAATARRPGGTPHPDGHPGGPFKPQHPDVCGRRG